MQQNIQQTEDDFIKNFSSESIPFATYLRHYRFQLIEFLHRGKEDFDFHKIDMPLQTKKKIEQEIQRIDFVLNSLKRYLNNQTNG